MLEKLDFLVRFWELNARHATAGRALTDAEQLELLSLMQLVTDDLAVPDERPAPRSLVGLPAQVIGDGTMKAIDLRSVSAGALVVTCATAVARGRSVIVRAADALSGVEYALPCRVAWVHAGAPFTMALVVDGVPLRSVFGSPSLSKVGVLSMGRQERLVA